MNIIYPFANNKRETNRKDDFKMKSRIYKLLCFALTAMLVSVIFTLGASANMSFRSGGISRSSEELADDTADKNGIVHEPDTSNADSHNTTNSGSHTDGTAPGTGEFADDTSNNGGTMNGNNTNGNSNDTANGPVESAIDGIVTDATDMVDDAASGMGIWGIIIVIAIIAAIAILLFAFFGRRR